MNPQEKAKELIAKFRDDPFTSQITTAGAKQCALICVDEIITAAETPPDTVTYWQQVREAITKL